MAKVVKRGKNRGVKVKCTGSYSPGKYGKGCRSTLLVVAKDVKSYYWHVSGYDDDSGTDYYVVCPDCGAETEVNPSRFGL